MKLYKTAVVAALVFGAAAAFADDYYDSEFNFHGATTIMRFMDGASIAPVLKAPNGTLYRLNVSNTGAITTQVMP